MARDGQIRATRGLCADCEVGAQRPAPRADARTGRPAEPTRAFTALSPNPCSAGEGGSAAAAPAGWLDLWIAAAAPDLVCLAEVLVGCDLHLRAASSWRRGPVPSGRRSPAGLPRFPRRLAEDPASGRQRSLRTVCSLGGTRSPPAEPVRLHRPPEGRCASLRDGPAAHPSPGRCRRRRAGYGEAR